MHGYCVYDLVSWLSLRRLWELVSRNKPLFVIHQDWERLHPEQRVRLKVAVRTLVIRSLRLSNAALFPVQEPALNSFSCVQALRAWPSVWHLHCIYALQTRRRNVVELTCRRWLRSAQPDRRSWVSVFRRERMDVCVYLFAPRIAVSCLFHSDKSRKLWKVDPTLRTALSACAGKRHQLGRGSINIPLKIQYRYV